MLFLNFLFLLPLLGLCLFFLNTHYNTTTKQHRQHGTIQSWDTTQHHRTFLNVHCNILCKLNPSTILLNNFEKNKNKNYTHTPTLIPTCTVSLSPFLTHTPTHKQTRNRLRKKRFVFLAETWKHPQLETLQSSVVSTLAKPDIFPIDFPPHSRNFASADILACTSLANISCASWRCCGEVSGKRATFVLWLKPWCQTPLI